jgi:hypothetical protein
LQLPNTKNNSAFTFEGKLNINAEEWNIAIIEQDIPCGSLA